MNSKKFYKLLEELKSSNSDYYMSLYYKGAEVAIIYYDGYLESIGVNDKDDHILVYNDTFGILVDDAEVNSI